MTKITYQTYKGWIILLDDETEIVYTTYNSKTNELYRAEKSLFEIKEEIDSLEGSGISSTKPISKNSVTDASVRTEGLVVCAAEACNMECKYCFANSGTYDNPNKPIMSRSVFDRIQTFANEINPDGLTSIHFFGGEPLLAIDEIVHFCQKMQQKCKTAGLTCPNFSITSNGTLITEELARQIASCGIKMCISIDGPRDIHDANRVYHGGRGSFDDVLLGVERLKQFQVPFAIEATVSISQIQVLSNDDLIQYFDFFDQSGAVIAGLYLDAFEADMNAQNEATLTRFLNTMVDYFFTQLCTRSSVNVVLVNVLSIMAAIVCGRERRIECGAGVSQVFISASGDVYPCQAYYAKRRDFLGTINSPEEVKTAQYEIMRRIHERTPKECGDCEYSRICDEKCPGMRLLTSNSENQLRNPFCFAQKVLINRILYHLSHFPDEASARLFEQNLKMAITIANSMSIHA